MRTISDSLLAAQKEATLDPIPRITLSLSGEDDIVLEVDRIKQIPSHEESEDSQTLQVILDNSDGYFTELALQGWDAVIEWGLVTSVGNEYSPCAPLKVISQTLSSDPNALLCYITCIGIPNLMEDDKASKNYFHHKSDTKTVKDLITEIADGQPVESTLTEEQTTSDGYKNLDHVTLDGVGQRMGIDNREIISISFKLKKYGSPTGDITFKILDADDSSPLASKVLGDAGDLTTSGVWYEATLSSPVTVDKSMVYESGEGGRGWVGGVWMYCEYTGGDVDNYVMVAYNTVAVKADEHYMQVNTGAPVTEDDRMDCAYKYTYTGAGVDCFDHCEAYEVVYDSEDDLIDVYQPKDGFKIYEGDTRLGVINKLLGYTGCFKRFEDDGKMHILVPTTG